MLVRADSLNVEERSIECVLATENPIRVYDWEQRAFVDEVLLMDGMEPVDQLPLLDNHARWSLDDVLGSVRNIVRQGSQLNVRLFFADLSDMGDDDQARRLERIWKKVQQRHQREVSLGYRVLESVIIPAGQTQNVMGKRFTAGRVPLKVATKWVAREGSLTPVGADQAATTRNEEQGSMNPLLRYLFSIGLRSEATVAEAWTFAAALTDAGQRAEVQRIIGANADLTPPQTMVDAMRSWTAPAPTNSGITSPSSGNGTGTENPEGTRSAPGTQAPGLGQQTPPVDVAEVVRRQLAEDRQRAAQISNMFREAGVDEPALQQRAIAEGWTSGQVAEELLPRVRQRGQQSPEGDGDGLFQGGVHVRRAATLETMALALMVRAGNVPLDHECFRSPFARGLAHPILRRDINDSQRQQAMDDADRLAGSMFHAVDACRMALQLTGQRVPHDTEEMIRSALSSGQVQELFTTNVNAQLLMGYTDADDSTWAWCRSEDRNDFRKNEGHTMGKFGALTVHAPGKTADDLDIGSDKYEYQLFRYSGKWTLDEMDIINDRLNGLNEVSPYDLGLTAAQIRPNLVYSRLLANPSVKGGALFASGRGNLFEAGSAMGITSLEAAATAFGKRRLRDRPLNLRLRHVIVPHDLGFKTETILASVERRNTAANTDYGTFNPISQKGIRVWADDRIGTGGCVDPETGTRYTGTATNWFAAGSPGENGAKTFVVGYRRGTNRAPRIRSYILDRGQWGWGWDINMDIGIGVEDFLALQKHTGQS